MEQTTKTRTRKSPAKRGRPRKTERKTVASGGEQLDARTETAIVRNYLAQLQTPKRRGRPVKPEQIRERLLEVLAKLEDSDEPLERLSLYQQKLEYEDRLEELEASGEGDSEELREQFISVAADYSDRKGVPYAAWRAMGVPVEVLRDAGLR